MTFSCCIASEQKETDFFDLAHNFSLYLEYTSRKYNKELRFKLIFPKLYIQ